jgi:phosphoribosylglycinamide formyltransferase-1
MNRKAPLSIGVLASGRGSNLQAIIDAIEEKRLDARIVCVITDKKEAKALERAATHGAKGIFLDPSGHESRGSYDQALVECLNENEVELVCLAGFMRILSPVFVKAFPQRILNIHPSLLPSFPGLKVQRKALEHGVKFSGCTVHYVTEEVDEGPIIIQASVPVLDDDTEECLSERILAEEHKIYPQAIQWIAEGRLKLEGRRVLLDGAPGDPGRGVVSQPPLEIFEQDIKGS